MPIKDIEELKNTDFSALEKDSEGVTILPVESEGIFNILQTLKNDNVYRYDMLIYVTAIDFVDKFELIYYLYSTILNKKLIIKTLIDKQNPQIESVETIYKAANWHEREVFDLFGIKFLNHPKLERILLPKGWKGYPLRKDYVQDDERLIWNKR